MQHLISVVIGAGCDILHSRTKRRLVRFDNFFQRLVEGTVDGIVVVVALNRLDGIEAVNRLQIIHAGKWSDQVFCAAHYIAEGHGAVLDLTFMVQTNKAAGITFLVCAVRIIPSTARKYIVPGRNACNAAFVNVCAVALDEVDFYIGNVVFVYTLFRTGQFNDRVTDGDDGKVTLAFAQITVQCYADFQPKQRDGQCVALAQDLQLQNRAQIDIHKAKVLQITDIQNAQQLIDDFKQAVQQLGLQFSTYDIVHIGLADKSACNLTAGDLFKRRGAAAIDFGKVCIPGKAARNGLLAALSLDHRAKPKACHRAVIHMGAE